MISLTKFERAEGKARAYYDMSLGIEKDRLVSQYDKVKLLEILEVTKSPDRWRQEIEKVKVPKKFYFEVAHNIDFYSFLNNIRDMIFVGGINPAGAIGNYISANQERLIRNKDSIIGSSLIMEISISALLVLARELGIAHQAKIVAAHLTKDYIAEMAI